MHYERRRLGRRDVHAPGDLRYGKADPKPCAVEGCEKRAHARGWCTTHYERWKTGADVNAPGDLRKRERRKGMQWLAARLELALASDDDACILDWPFSRDPFGYAQTWTGKTEKAHCVILGMTKGPRPPGYVARHLCGNGHLGCIHPRHLEWGTVAQNHADMVAHGTSLRGSRHGFAKLTEDDVRAIRASTLSNKALASKYGVSATKIYQVINRKAWAWLP